MTVLKRRPTVKTLILIITTVAVLAVGMPMASAYEAHMINVTCRVDKPPTETLFKTMTLADETEVGIFLGLVEGMEIPNFPYDPLDPTTLPNPWLFDPEVDPPTSDDVVPINTFILWLVTITVSNTEG